MQPARELTTSHRRRRSGDDGRSITQQSRARALQKFRILPPLLMLAFSLGCAALRPDGITPAFVLLMTVVAMAATGYHLAIHWAQNWLRIDTVFLFGFFVVNFQWPLMYSVSDLVPVYSFQARSLDYAGNFAVAVGTASLLSWIIGYALINPEMSEDRRDAIFGSRRLALAFLISMAGFTYFAGEAFFSRSIYQIQQMYLYQTTEGISSYFYTFAEIISVIVVSYIIYKKVNADTSVRYEGARELTSYSQVLALLLLLYCGIFLVGGDRGQIVSVILGAALAWAARVRSIRAWEFFVLAIAGFMIFTAIGIWRAGGDSDFGRMITSFGYWGISTNLAQSFVALTQASVIVEQKGLFFGQLWLSQLLGLVPFAQGWYLSYTGREIAEISSAMQITTYTLGRQASSGLGTSFVSDIYMNFGLIGVIVLSTGYGALCRQMSHWLLARSGFLKYFSAIAFAAFILYVNRSSILHQLKPIIWGLGLIFLLVQVRCIGRPAYGRAS